MTRFQRSYTFFLFEIITTKIRLLGIPIASWLDSVCVCVATSVPKSTYPNLPQVYMVYILEKLPKPHYNHQLATTTP